MKMSTVQHTEIKEMMNRESHIELEETHSLERRESFRIKRQL